jgi:hypothetical protein
VCHNPEAAHSVDENFNHIVSDFQVNASHRQPRQETVTSSESNHVVQTSRSRKRRAVDAGDGMKYICSCSLITVRSCW